MTAAVLWRWPAAGVAIIEQWQWYTDVLSAVTAESQHRSLMDSPRVRLGYDGIVEHAEKRKLETALHTTGLSPWQAPLHCDGSALAASSAAGSSTVTVIDLTPPMAVGSAVVLHDALMLVSEIATVLSIAGAVITLSAPLIYDWAAYSQITPLRNSRFESMPTLSRFSGSAIVYRIEFTLTEPVIFDAPASPVMYRGLPMLELRPNWISDPTYAPLRAALTVDEGIGPVAIIDLPGLALVAQAQRHTIIGRQQIDAFRQRLYALKGRWAPVWLPTWSLDLMVVANVASGATWFDAAAIGMAGLTPARNRRDVRIELSDGTIIYRRITGITALSTGVERFAVDSSLPAFLADAVLEVSFMTLSRQNADTNVLQWWSFDVLDCDLAFQAVSDDV